MRKNSKVSIYKLEKAESDKFKYFYKATLCELVRNSKKKKGGPWEYVFYNGVRIYTDKELEVANYDLGLNKEQLLDFVNISNPQHSILRILDFSYENITCYTMNGAMLTDSSGRPKKTQKLIIYDFDYDCVGWKPEESKEKDLDKKMEKLKVSYENKIQKLKDKNAEVLEKALSMEKAKIEKLKEKIIQKDKNYKKLYLRNRQLAKSIESYGERIKKVRAKRHSAISQKYQMKRKLMEATKVVEEPNIYEEPTLQVGDDLIISFTDM